MFLSGQLLHRNKTSPCSAGANILAPEDSVTESRHCGGWFLLASGAGPPQHRKHELRCGQRGEAGSVPLTPAAVCELHCGSARHLLVPRRMRRCRRQETDCPLCKVCWQAPAEDAGALGYTGWAQWAIFLSAAVGDTVSFLAWRVTEPQGHDIPGSSGFHLPLCVWAHACDHNGGFSLALHPDLWFRGMVRPSYSSSRIDDRSIAVAHLPLCTVLFQPVFWGLSTLPTPLPTEAFSSVNIANLTVSQLSFSPHLHTP